MTERLKTVLEKISTIPNPINSSLIEEFYQFMVDNRKSDSYKKNSLKTPILFSHELAPNVTFYDIQKKEMIVGFLDKRIKPKSDDPDKRDKYLSPYIESITQKASPISAEVILKSKSGRSMASGEENITAANIEEFRPAEETIKQTIIRFQELGFAVSPGGITLTISGEPALFEKVFKVKINIEKQYSGGIIIRTDRQISIPACLSHLVEKVEFIPPPIFFDRK
jgi:hypothetical protein